MHLDRVRPAGAWISPTVPGASDYQRLDANLSKAINGDVGSTVVSGTSPPAVTFTGTPTASVRSIEIDITAGGNPGTFKWFLNGIVQATGVSTGLGTYALVGTGMTAHFPSATYSTDNVFRFGPWSPTTPIYVGGAGLNLTAGTLLGGLRTERGGLACDWLKRPSAAAFAPARPHLVGEFHNLRRSRAPHDAPRRLVYLGWCDDTGAESLSAQRRHFEAHLRRRQLRVHHIRRTGRWRHVDTPRLLVRRSGQLRQHHHTHLRTWNVRRMASDDCVHARAVCPC